MTFISGRLVASVIFLSLSFLSRSFDKIRRNAGRIPPLTLRLLLESEEQTIASSRTTSKWWKLPVAGFGSLTQNGMTAQNRRHNPDQSSSTPTGMDSSLYEYRPPMDLSNPRLRKLAAALGPAFMRVSGTWANSTYFHDSDAPPPHNPPHGFGSVLTREQWKGVIDFSNAANAKIVTSFATSAGTRDASDVWTPEQARRLLQYTATIGGAIAAAQFMNEPTYAGPGGAPKGYDAVRLRARFCGVPSIPQAIISRRDYSRT